MKGQLYSITPEQMKKLGSWHEKDLEFARLSEPLLAGFYRGELHCIVGLIPTTLLTDRAYLWLITTEAVRSCPTALVWQSRWFIADMLRRYSVLYGYCFDAEPQRWLRWLGAEFVGSMFTLRAR
jgi:hypothetical protein